MSIQLNDYREVTGPGVVEELRVLAERVAGRRMQHINSTPVGGGVAEILTRLVPLLRELGLEATWDVIKFDRVFFGVT
jgi:trehalose synthase